MLKAIKGDKLGEIIYSVRGDLQNDPEVLYEACKNIGTLEPLEISSKYMNNEKLLKEDLKKAGFIKENSKKR